MLTNDQYFAGYNNTGRGGAIPDRASSLQQLNRRRMFEGNKPCFSHVLWTYSCSIAEETPPRSKKLYIVTITIKIIGVSSFVENNFSKINFVILV